MEKKNILDMGFAEVAAGGLARLIGREQHEATGITPVSLEDVSTKGWWKNKRGDKIHVDPGTMFMILDGEELKIVDLETPRKILEEGGYELTSLPPSERVVPATEGTTEEAVVPSAQVVDLAEVRAAQGVVGDVSVEGEEKSAPDVTVQKMQEEILASKEHVMNRLKSIETIFSESDASDEKIEELRAEVLKLSLEVSSLYVQALADEEGPAEEYLSQGKEKLSKLQDFLLQAEALVANAQDIAGNRQVKKQRGSTRAARRASLGSASVEGIDEMTPESSDTKDATVGNVAVAHVGNLEALLKAKENARPASVEPIVISAVSDIQLAGASSDAAKPKSEKKPRAKKSKEPKKEGITGDTGGPKGPEGPDFGMVLEELRVKVIGLIDAIKTPEDYALFRHGMTKADKQGNRHFLGLSDIKGQTRREELTKEELEKIYMVERDLEMATRAKFDTLVKTDLDTQYDREQARVMAAEDVETLERLAADWAEKPNVVFVWKDILIDLPPVEQSRVVEEYGRCSEELSNNLLEKKRELERKSVRKELDAFLERGSKEQEKVAMFKKMIQEEYKAWSEDVYRSAIKSGGKVSMKDRKILWAEKKGEMIFQKAIVEHLRRFDDIDSETGKKIFDAIIKGFEEGN